MRRAARQDGNHGTIVGYFERFGCSVVNTHMVGNGFPDIVVGLNQKSALVEIKDPSKVPSKRELTQDEKKFQASWLGNYFIVEDLSDVIALVKALER